jgi:hypothetical protein
MVQISCFYVHYNIAPIFFVFIKYNNYFKVILNNIYIILENKQLVDNTELFQIYILSLLCTEDASIISYKNIYGVNTMRYWKNLYFSSNYKFIELNKYYKNILVEPKHSSSKNEYIKFNKYLFNYMNVIKHPLNLIIEFINHNTKEEFNIINKYKKIMLLMCVKRRLGYDIYIKIKNDLC